VPEFRWILPSSAIANSDKEVRQSSEVRVALGTPNVEKFRSAQEMPWEPLASPRPSRAAAFGPPVLAAIGPLVSKVHSQEELYVQHGRAIVLTGHARARKGSNSNWLRETGAEWQM
ncbi:MAG: hypothetical protein ACRED2_14445, partial [Methylocella sp.]